MKKIVIDEKTQNQRLDKFLRRYLPNAGTGFLYRMLREKKIKLNGKKSDGNAILHAGDELSIFFSDETLEKFMGEEATFTEVKISQKEGKSFASGILYEDENLLILNKPAGMLSQRGEGKEPSACEYLLDYLRKKGSLSSEDEKIYKPSVVNRLDRNTSGLLVCAKNLPAAQLLSQMFKERSLKKEYRALVRGKILEKRDLTAFLKKDGSSNKVKVSSTSQPGFEKIETAYEPLGYIDDDTLLNVDLKTGKTHQIRAHLSQTGHPLIGDPKYGDKEANRFYSEQYQLKRQFLHAYRLTFPKTEGILEGVSGKSFIAELPQELERIERKIKYVIEETR